MNSIGQNHELRYQLWLRAPQRHRKWAKNIRYKPSRPNWKHWKTNRTTLKWTKPVRTKCHWFNGINIIKMRRNRAVRKIINIVWRGENIQVHRTTEGNATQEDETSNKGKGANWLYRWGRVADWFIQFDLIYRLFSASYILFCFLMFPHSQEGKSPFSVKALLARNIFLS